jgi:hypothetical protein
MQMRLVLLVAALATLGCRRAPSVAVECAPGGRCASPAAGVIASATAALELPDLRSAGVRSSDRRELRIWRTGYPPAVGDLWRFVDDSAGVTGFERVRWWSTLDTAVRNYERLADGPECHPLIQKGGVDVCLIRRLGMPYASNRLRMLEQRGIWTLSGSAVPPDTSSPCVDLCLAPSVIVVEARVGLRYRTYGYAISPSSPDSLLQHVALLLRGMDQ